MSSQANNPWSNPTHPTAIAAMKQTHQRVYIPVTQRAQQPPAHNNAWAHHQHQFQPQVQAQSQSQAQAWAPYPACYPTVMPTVNSAFVPIASPLMQYPGSSSNNSGLQFYSAPVQSPVGTNHFQGQTTAQVHTHNPGRAQEAGAHNPNIQMVPQVASSDNEFWCRELNGEYTLRTMNTIIQTLQPGAWARGSSGYPYFVRHAK